jgi:transaldolase
MNKLAQLRAMTTVVADTGDIEAIRQHKPVDATTNPSLILKAAQQTQYKELISAAIGATLGKKGTTDEALSECILTILINIADEILEIIPGRVSLEVDAHASFDTEITLQHTYKLIDACINANIDTSRVLIKVASSWEGIRAAEVLEKEGINCNCTLVFSTTQAIACADAGVFLISPFVGRIYDWYNNQGELESYTPEQDPGVLSVKSIYDYLKHHAYNTIVMGASFRNIQQIEQLAGCDNLTISPALLTELENDHAPLKRKLAPENVPTTPKTIYSESEFRWDMNEDRMATEKLAEGIRMFAQDNDKLKEFLTTFS